MAEQTDDPFLDAVAGAADADDKMLCFQQFEGLFDGLLVKLDDWIAAGFLIARIL